MHLLCNQEANPLCLPGFKQFDNIGVILQSQKERIRIIIAIDEIIIIFEGVSFNFVYNLPVT